MQGKLAWQDAEMFMHYFNMTGDATAMPKFVLYSAHAETIAPILHAFESPLLLNPTPASMVLVNFYADQHEGELSETEAAEQIHVEIEYVPQLRLSDEKDTIAAMSITEFQRWITDALDNYVEESGVGTRSVPAMCDQAYVRSAEDMYGDPDQFRKDLYKAWDFNPPQPTEMAESDLFLQN